MRLNKMWEEVKRLKGKSLLTKTGKVIRITNKKEEITDKHLIVYRNSANGSIKAVKIFRKQLEDMYNYILNKGKLDMPMFNIQLEFGIKEAVCAYSILAALPRIKCIDEKKRPLTTLRINK